MDAPIEPTAKQGQYLAFIYYDTKLNGRPPAASDTLAEYDRLIQKPPGRCANPSQKNASQYICFGDQPERKWNRGSDDRCCERQPNWCRATSNDLFDD